MEQEYQVELPMEEEDGAPDNSTTTNISLSEGNTSHSNTNLDNQPLQEVDQVQPEPPLGLGLHNILMAYEDE